MSEEEFFNRLLNKIAKEFGYDTASTLELMFMTREKKVEQLENIRKETIEYINNHQLVFRLSSKKQIENWFDEFYKDLLNTLNRGDNKYE